MIRGVIFDLGSTLLRFESDWSQVLEESSLALANQVDREGFSLDSASFAETFSQEIQENNQLRQQDWIERTSASLLRKVLRRFGFKEVSEAVIQRALQEFYAISETHWAPMEGVYDVLQELQAEGLRLAIISNAGDEGNVQRLIDNANLRSYFEPILISAAEGIRKPNPRLFESVLLVWSLPPDQVVMVGDNLQADILGAQNAGVHQIWLTAQADTPSNREHVSIIVPEATAERITDVPAVLRTLGDFPLGG